MAAKPVNFFVGHTVYVKVTVCYCLHFTTYTYNTCTKYSLHVNLFASSMGQRPIKYKDGTLWNSFRPFSHWKVSFESDFRKVTCLCKRSTFKSLALSTVTFAKYNMFYLKQLLKETFQCERKSVFTMLNNLINRAVYNFLRL